MNRSIFPANVLKSALFNVGSIGFKGGIVPSDEPAFGLPPLPSALWQTAQLAANIFCPELGSPVSPRAGPGPPGLDGRATSSVGSGSVPWVAVGAAAAT